MGYGTGIYPPGIVRPGSYKYAVTKPRRRSYKRKAYGYGGTIRRGRGMQRQINSLNRRVGGFEGLELKFLDRSIAATALFSAAGNTLAVYDPTQDCLNSMTQGDGESQRSGRFISMKSIKVKGTIKRVEEEDGTTFREPHRWSIYLVMDTQSNEAKMVSEDVFTNKSAVVGQNSDMFRNMQHTDRFKILDVQKGILPMNFQQYVVDKLTIAGSKQSFNLSYRWPRGKRVLFNGTTGLIANIQDVSLHVLAFIDSTNVTSSVISYNSRMRFTST